MKWSIRESVDVYFKAISTFKLGARTIRAGEPIMIFDSVKTSTLEVTAENSYVTGGRGNARILSFEGNKAMSFNFEEALLSAEGLAILAGADLIPSRNPNLRGSPDARSIISHFTETYSVATADQADNDLTNNYEKRADLGNAAPRGGQDNIWLTRKPYVGQNASIHVILQDQAGAMSGAPIQVNLSNISSRDKASPTSVDSHYSYIRKFQEGNTFIAFNANGIPLSNEEYPVLDFENKNTSHMSNSEAVFDDQVKHYVSVPEPDSDDEALNWQPFWGSRTDYERKITDTEYSYLIGQPKAFKPGSRIVYKLNVPSILYQDIVLIDYYVEYQHDATQISILPDKFAPFVYVEGSSLLRRASDGKDLPVEFVIPKLKITTALTFTLQSTGDASTFNFQGDAYPAFSKFDLTRKVLADIQILDADDNYDAGEADNQESHPTSYRRFRYNIDSNGEYIWKDPSIMAHSNIDVSDSPDYDPTIGGPSTLTPGIGSIDKYARIDLAVADGQKLTSGSITLEGIGEMAITASEVQPVVFPSGGKPQTYNFSEGKFADVTEISITGIVRKINIESTPFTKMSGFLAESLQVFQSTNSQMTNIDWTDFNNLKEVTLINEPITSLDLTTPIGATKTLEVLNINNCPRFNSITLGELPKLKELNLAYDVEGSALVPLQTIEFFDKTYVYEELEKVNLTGSRYTIPENIETEDVKNFYDITKENSLYNHLPNRKGKTAGILNFGDSKMVRAFKDYKEAYNDKKWDIRPETISLADIEITFDLAQAEDGIDRTDMKIGVCGEISENEDEQEDGILLFLEGYESEQQVSDWYEWPLDEVTGEPKPAIYTLEKLFGDVFKNHPEIVQSSLVLRIQGRLTKLFTDYLPVTKVEDKQGQALKDLKTFKGVQMSHTALESVDFSEWVDTLQEIRVTDNDKLTSIDLDPQ